MSQVLETTRVPLKLPEDAFRKAKSVMGEFTAEQLNPGDLLYVGIARGMHHFVKVESVVDDDDSTFMSINGGVFSRGEKVQAIVGISFA